jgi:hypothetical protein
MTQIAEALTAERPTTQTAFDLFREAVEKRNGSVRVNGKYHITNCPGPNHQRGDQNPSLHFWIDLADDGRPTVRTKCHSGNCTPAQIYKGFGIDSHSIPTIYSLALPKEPVVTLFDLATYTGIDWQILYNLGWEDAVETFHKPDGTAYKLRGVKHPYYLSDGSPYERSKLRIRLEKKGKHDRWVWTEGDVPTPIAYGLQSLPDAVKQGYIVLVEGESDYATLYGGYGIPCLGIPGATQVAKTLKASMLKDIPRVYVIQEQTDQAGQNFPYEVKRRLVETGYTGEVLRVPLRTITGAKDPNDLHKRLYHQMRDQKSLQPFKDAFQQALDQAQTMDVDTALPEIEYKHLEGIPEAIAKDIASRNKPALKKRSAEIAALSDIERARIRVAIRDIFGTDFPLREFDDLIRVERQVQESLKRKKTPNIISARALLQKQIPRKEWPVPGILPTGLIILAGKQKIGKSWFDLQLGMAISTGGKAFGSIPAEAGDVLYLALEDNELRVQDRLSQLLTPGEPAPDNFEIATEWPRLDAEGIALLEEWITSHQKAKLIIIDPWVKAKPRVKSRHGETGYDAEYEALEEVKRLADTYGICILIQFHVRKASADDPFDEVNATSGATACADGFLLLKRARGESDATLWGTGRDYKDDVDLALSFTNGWWNILGNASAYALTKASREVIDVLNQSNMPLYPKEIASELSLPVGTIRKRLLDMKERGEIKDTGTGYISLLPSQKSNDTSAKLGNGGNASNEGNGGNGGNAEENLSTEVTQEAQNVTPIKQRYLAEETEVTAITQPVEPSQLMSVTSVTPVTNNTQIATSIEERYPTVQNEVTPPTSNGSQEGSVTSVTTEDRAMFARVSQSVGQLQLKNQTCQGVFTYGQYLDDIQKALASEEPSRLKWARDEMIKMMSLRKI